MCVDDFKSWKQVNTSCIHFLFNLQIRFICEVCQFFLALNVLLNNDSTSCCTCLLSPVDEKETAAENEVCVLGFYGTPCVIFPLTVHTAHSISSGWLRSLLTVKDAVYDNNAIMLCAFFPLCVIHYLQPFLCAPPPQALFVDSSFTFLHSSSLTFVSSQFHPSNNLLCGNYPPFYSLCPCLLPLCVCVCVLSLVAYGRALTAPTPG